MSHTRKDHTAKNSTHSITPIELPCNECETYPSPIDVDTLQNQDTITEYHNRLSLFMSITMAFHAYNRATKQYYTMDKLHEMSHRAPIPAFQQTLEYRYSDTTSWLLPISIAHYQPIIALLDTGSSCSSMRVCDIPDRYLCTIIKPQQPVISIVTQCVKEAGMLDDLLSLQDGITYLQDDYKKRKHVSYMQNLRMTKSSDFPNILGIKNLIGFSIILTGNREEPAILTDDQAYLYYYYTLKDSNPLTVLFSSKSSSPSILLSINELDALFVLDSGFYSNEQSYIINIPPIFASTIGLVYRDDKERHDGKYIMFHVLEKSEFKYSLQISNDNTGIKLCVMSELPFFLISQNIIHESLGYFCFQPLTNTESRHLTPDYHVTFSHNGINWIAHGKIALTCFEESMKNPKKYLDYSTISSTIDQTPPPVQQHTAPIVLQNAPEMFLENSVFAYNTPTSSQYTQEYLEENLSCSPGL